MEEASQHQQQLDQLLQQHKIEFDYIRLNFDYSTDSLSITLQNTASIEDNDEILHKSLTNLLHRAPPMCAQL